MILVYIREFAIKKYKAEEWNLYFFLRSSDYSRIVLKILDRVEFNIFRNVKSFQKTQNVSRISYTKILLEFPHRYKIEPSDKPYHMFRCLKMVRN